MSVDPSSPEHRQLQGARSERKSRDQLFSQRHKKSSSTASEAQSIQKSLMRTQHLLKNELQRVSHVQTAIEEDGNVLHQTMDHHKSLNTKNAQKALTSLQRARQSEQRILMASVVFFCVVALYVLWSRVLLRLEFIYQLLVVIVSFLTKLYEATILVSGVIISAATKLYKTKILGEEDEEEW
jgi:hypothetical protein